MAVYIGTAPSTYVLLSEWGGINEWSELTLNWISSVRNQTTYWQWYTTASAQAWIHYKLFEKKIIWFDIVGYIAYNSGNYDATDIFLTPSTSDMNSNANKWITNGISLDLTSYSDNSSTGLVVIRNWSGGNLTNKVYQAKSTSAVTATWKWRLENWQWTISVVLSNWQSWNTTFTPTYSWDLHMIWFKWFWYSSWTAVWRFNSVSVILQI